MDRLKTGDTVRLKSGGASMTVASSKAISSDELEVYCAWMHDGELRHGTFRPEMLITPEGEALRYGLSRQEVDKMKADGYFLNDFSEQ
jgi:uncharacterized protein YodC (DUF2158 family)